jgi:hypothetical protein
MGEGRLLRQGKEGVRSRAAGNPLGWKAEAGPLDGRGRGQREGCQGSGGLGRGGGHLFWAQLAASRWHDLQNWGRGSRPCEFLRLGPGAR